MKDKKEKGEKIKKKILKKKPEKECQKAKKVNNTKKNGATKGKKISKISKVKKNVSSKTKGESVINKLLSLFLVVIIALNVFATKVSNGDGLELMPENELDITRKTVDEQIGNETFGGVLNGLLGGFLDLEDDKIIFNPDNQSLINEYGRLKVKPGGLLTSHFRGDQFVGDEDVAAAGVQKFVTSAMLYKNLTSLQGIPTVTTESYKVWTSGTNGTSGAGNVGAWKGIITTLAEAINDTDVPSAKLLKTSVDAKVDKTITVNGHELSSNVTVTKSDVGLSNVVNTGDSATPESGGTKKFTTGGAYTELAKKQDKFPATTTANQILASTAANGTYTLRTVGNGLAINGSGVLGHSNSVTAQTSGIGSATAAIKSLKYDNYGHITGVTTETMYPPTTGQTSSYYWRGNGTGKVGVWQANATTVSNGNTALVTSGAVYNEVIKKQDKLPATTTANQILASTAANGTYTLRTVGNALAINSSGVLGHSNSVTAQTTGIGSVNAAIKNLKYDSGGHITGVTTETMYPPTSRGTNDQKGYVWTGGGTSNPDWKVLCPFPVGSVIIAIDDSNPPDSVWKGTTWSKLSTGRCLWNTASGGGGNIAAGVPNVSGSFQVIDAHTTYLGVSSSTGVFYGSNPGAMHNPNGGGDSGVTCDAQLNFIASACKSIFGKSDTVQPPAIAVCMWKRTG